MNNLALALKDTNRLAEAEPLYRRALEIFLKFTRATGHPHPHLMDAANNYAGLLIEMGVPRAEADERVKKLFAEYGVDIGAGGQETPPLSQRLRAFVERLMRRSDRR